MRPEDLLAALQQRPFTPLRLYLSNDNILEIRHPEMVMVGETTALIFFPGKMQAPPIFDRYETISLHHINRLERVAQPVPASN